MNLLPWLTAVPPLIALTLTLFNLVFWPRGRKAEVGRTVSVLIPARNEGEVIEATVRAALAQDVLEVLVYDDQSTDETATILRNVANEDARLRALSGQDLPEGWVGKPHACHQLAGQARGELLLFVDADVTLEPDGLERIIGLLDDYSADVVTAVPRQRVGTFFERLILPLLHVTYVSWLPMPLVWRTADARFLAANGQILAVSRPAYDAVGGFRAVRDAVVDDMAFCALQKRSGRRVIFADGHHIASCRMYSSTREVWEGFSKNIFEGVGGRLGLLFVLGLYFATFVWPWVALFGPDVLFVPALVGVAANVTQRVLLALRHRHPMEGIVLVPLAALALCAIAVNSWVWHMRRSITWSGRSYDRKEARSG